MSRHRRDRTNQRIVVRACVTLTVLLCWGCGEKAIPTAPYTDVAVPGCQHDDECAVETTACQRGVCDLSTGACTTETMGYGSPCDPGLPCMLGRCNSGVCVSEEVMHCDDGNPCTEDQCDLEVGCVWLPRIGSCDDGNVCTESDSCNAGVCEAGVYVCDDCTADSDCAPHDDGDACNGVLFCDLASQRCRTLSDSVTICLNDSPCLANTCDPNTGQCVSTARPDGTVCSDESLCTMEDRCQEGACVGIALQCPAQSGGCTATHCEPLTACQNAALSDIPCQDGNLCTSNDVCEMGTCVGTSLETCDCSADSDCTIYDDDDQCNGRVRCIQSECVTDPSTVVHCAPPGGPCQTVTCQAESGECLTLATLGVCADGDACTVDDTCSAGVCVGQPLVCDDEDPCTQDSCESAIGCVFAPIPGCEEGCDPPCAPGTSCEDGVCTVDGCNLEGACAPGTTLACGCGVQTCNDQCQWGTCVTACPWYQSCVNGGCVLPSPLAYLRSPGPGTADAYLAPTTYTGAFLQPPQGNGPPYWHATQGGTPVEMTANEGKNCAKDANLIGGWGNGWTDSCWYPNTLGSQTGTEVWLRANAASGPTSYFGGGGL